MHIELLPQSVAMIVLDQEGWFITMNAAAEHLLGNNVIDFINNWQPMSDQTIIDFNHRSIRVDTLKTNQATYLMLFDENAPNGKHAEPPRREIKSARPEPKRANDLISIKAKSTAMIAHQFGTPISAIRLKSYLLKKHLDSLSKARITEHLEQIEAQLDQMVDLLDDLMLVNQVYSSEQAVSFSALDLEAFCKKVIDQMMFDLDGRDIMLTYSGNMSNVQLDRRLIRYILSNLIGFVVKYSASAVRIDVRRVDNSVTFTVTAPEVLLPAQELDRLFLQASHPNGTSGLSSIGIGLSIMKTCVEMYGGMINVKSKPEVGTTFVVTLPCRDA